MSAWVIVRSDLTDRIRKLLNLDGGGDIDADYLRAAHVSVWDHTLTVYDREGPDARPILYLAKGEWRAAGYAK